MAPAVWDATVRVHNPNATMANASFHLLVRQANPAPLTCTDTVPAGDTKRHENAVRLILARQTFEALRMASNVKVAVRSRIHSQAGDLDDPLGQFFAGVPASFAIGAGQVTGLLDAPVEHGVGRVPEPARERWRAAWRRHASEKRYSAPKRRPRRRSRPRLVEVAIDGGPTGREVTLDHPREAGFWGIFEVLPRAGSGLFALSERYESDFGLLEPAG